MVEQLLPADTFTIFPVFCRVGGAIMLLPGFGEVFVPARVRLVIALAITLVVTPIVGPTLPGAPDRLVEASALIGAELTVGLFLGAMARMLVSALHTAGVIIGFHTSLANAQLFDPVNAQQGAIFGSFLNVLGVFLIFVGDLHHLMLAAIVKSYQTFAPGLALPIGDFTELAVRMVAQSFVIAMQLAAPFMVVGMLFYLGLGLLTRLMPQVQMFFIVMPIQIMLGFSVLALTLSAGMMWFLGNFENIYGGIVGLG